MGGVIIGAEDGSLRKDNMDWGQAAVWVIN